jgi:hypothetical protein
VRKRAAEGAAFRHVGGGDSREVHNIQASHFAEEFFISILALVKIDVIDVGWERHGLEIDI